MNNPKKNIGFKVPLKYFEKLEQKILREVKEGVNIQNIINILVIIIQQEFLVEMKLTQVKSYTILQ